MARKRGRSVIPIQLIIENDPTAWRYESLEDALQSSLPLLAEAIMHQPHRLAGSMNRLTDSNGGTGEATRIDPGTAN